MSRMTINNLLSVGAGIASGMLQGQSDARQYQAQQAQQQAEQRRAEQASKLAQAHFAATLASDVRDPEQYSSLMGQAATLGGIAPPTGGFRMPDPNLDEGYKFAIGQRRQAVLGATPGSPDAAAQQGALGSLMEGQRTHAPLGSLQGPQQVRTPLLAPGVPTLPAATDATVKLPLGPAGLAGLPGQVDAKGLGAQVKDRIAFWNEAVRRGQVAPEFKEQVNGIIADLQGLATPSTPAEEAQVQQIFQGGADLLRKGALTRDPNALALEEARKTSAETRAGMLTERARNDSLLRNNQLLTNIRSAKSPGERLKMIDQQQALARGSGGLIEPYGGPDYDRTPQDVPTTVSTPQRPVGTPARGAAPDSSVIPIQPPPLVTQGTRKETPEEVSARRNLTSAADMQNPNDPRERKLKADHLQAVIRDGASLLKSGRLVGAAQDPIVESMAEAATELKRMGLSTGPLIPAGSRLGDMTAYQRERLRLAERGLDLGESRFAETQYHNLATEAQGDQKINKPNAALIGQLKAAAVQGRQDWLNFLKRPDVQFADPSFSTATKDRPGVKAGTRVPTNQPGWTNFPTPWDNPAAFEKAGEAIRSGADPNPLHAEAWNILNRAGKAQRVYERQVQGTNAPAAAKTAPAGPAPGGAPAALPQAGGAGQQAAPPPVPAGKITRQDYINAALARHIPRALAEARAAKRGLR